jgi:16S rRNA U1498 N3-methylase RsmE
VGERGEITVTDPELIHQMVNVFRFKTFDKVILFDGSGFEYEAEIILISKKEEDDIKEEDEEEGGEVEKILISSASASLHCCRYVEEGLTYEGGFE